MSGEGYLRRSSWKADAIRRGDLKISGPIPITEDMPLNEEEERDFAERQKVEGPPSVPTPIDATQEQSWCQNRNQHEVTPLNVPPNLPKDDVVPSNQNVDSVEDRPKTREDNRQPQQSHLAAAGARGDMDSTHRRSATEPQSYSTPSPYPSIVDSSMKTTPKKRKSGLRNVFRKMFGRRSRGEMIEEDEEGETLSRGHSHHNSDPGLLRASIERNRRRGPRISDLPVKEPKPINPLGQHLPFPMNVNAPQEASPPHEYLTFEVPPPDLGRRRATLPGILPAADTPSLNGRVKRLETWDEKNDDGLLPSPQIGIALSSPPAPSIHSIRSKRRSRSAGALRDLAKIGRPSVERRRSAEIRYWRNSHASGSIYSNNTPRPRTAQTVDTVMSTNTKDTTTEPKPSESVTETTTIDRCPTQTIPQHDEDLSQNQLPVEAFNFGILKSRFSDDEDSEQQTAAQSQSQSRARVHSRPQSHQSERHRRRLSIEDRVKDLEEGMRTLETSVHRLSGKSNRQAIFLENAPKGRRGSSRNRSSSGASERQESHHSSSRSRPNSQHLPLRQNSEVEERLASASPTMAPLSAVNEDTASRKNSVLEAQPALISYTTLLSHLTSLQTSLTHERQSRKVLEAQVTTLQRELSDLHTLVNRLIHQSSHSRAENYPTPSPDTLMTGGNEEKVPTPRASRGVFAGGEDSGIAGLGYVSESEGSSKEDVHSPEAWATPKEESGFLFQGRGEADMF